MELASNNGSIAGRDTMPPASGPVPPPAPAAPSKPAEADVCGTCGGQADNPGQRRPTKGQIAAVGVLMLIVAGIILVAFRSSWTAGRDASLAAHSDQDSADLYMIGVDGLIVVAIIVLVLLRHNVSGRRYCLTIIATYTAASWLLNYLHGLGMFTNEPVPDRPVPPWPVVLIIASLVVGSIFLGSHLLVFVWRHLFPDPLESSAHEVPGQSVPPPGHDVPPAQTVPVPPESAYEAAKAGYRYSLLPGRKKLSQRDMRARYGVSKSEASQIQREVNAELGLTPAVDAPGPDSANPAPAG